MKLDPAATILFCSITLVVAIITYESMKGAPTVPPVDIAFTNAGLPPSLKEKLIDQIRMENTVLNEADQYLQANLQCNHRLDPEQVQTLSKHVDQALGDAYIVIKEAEETK